MKPRSFKQFGKVIGSAILLALAVEAGLILPEAQAAQNEVVVRVVQNDRGGVVGRRAEEINEIRSSRDRVEIRGQVCLSSCTMYLGAGNVCVDPDTKFGFHGPSYFGKPLPPEQFDYWSKVIASFYPSKLQDWYMEEGRFKSQGYFTLKGSQLIEMGVPECAPRSAAKSGNNW